MNATHDGSDRRPLAEEAGAVIKRERRHCRIKAKGVLATHQSGETGPSGMLENHDKPGIRRPVAWLLSEQEDQIGRADRLMRQCPLHLLGRRDITEATRWATRVMDRPFKILKLTS